MNEEEINYNAAKSYLNLQSNKLFFQIGTNDGNDAFRLLVEDYQPKKTFLVEPWEDLYSKIHESYKGKNYNLIEGVVHDKERGEANLYFPENDFNRPQHSTLAPMTNWNKQKLRPVTVSAYNFNDICVEHNIKEIELLMLDTEGFDFAILNSIDFSKVKINNIITENFGFDTETYYTEYKDKKFFGKTGMDNIYKKIAKLNYKILKFKRDTFFQLQ
tara:strand:- start:367 stop:1014 length:648 start_codon:yes stop_codon:yes gene_type:complete